MPVTMSASTGHAAVWSRALTSVLLPRLNSPTTATVTARCSTIVRTPASRSARSGRSRRPARAPLASIAATRSRTAAGRTGGWRSRTAAVVGVGCRPRRGRLRSCGSGAAVRRGLLGLDLAARSGCRLPGEEVVAVGAEGRPLLVGVVAVAAPDHGRAAAHRHRGARTVRPSSVRLAREPRPGQRLRPRRRGAEWLEARFWWRRRTSAAPAGNATPRGRPSACSAGPTSAGTSPGADRRPTDTARDHPHRAPRPPRRTPTAGPSQPPPPPAVPVAAGADAGAPPRPPVRRVPSAAGQPRDPTLLQPVRVPARGRRRRGRAVRPRRHCPAGMVGPGGAGRAPRVPPQPAAALPLAPGAAWRSRRGRGRGLVLTLTGNNPVGYVQERWRELTGDVKPVDNVTAAAQAEGLGGAHGTTSRTSPDPARRPGRRRGPRMPPLPDECWESPARRARSCSAGTSRPGCAASTSGRASMPTTATGRCSSCPSGSA